MQGHISRRWLPTKYPDMFIDNNDLSVRLALVQRAKQSAAGL